MFCPTCGNLVTEEQELCAQCGRQLAGLGSAPAASPRPTVRAAAEEPPRPPEHPCQDHPDMPVAGTCERCGRFICARCAPELAGAGKAYCEACRLRMAPEVPATDGIGGWLILPALGLIVTPLALLATVATLVSTLLKPLQPEWQIALALETLLNLAFLAFNVFVAVRFFQKRRGVPRLMVVYYLTALLLPLFDSVVISALAQDSSPADSASLLRSVVVSGIWVAYFSVSKRAAATFVR